MLIVNAAGDKRSGYILMNVIFGLFFTLPLFLVVFKVPERSQFSKGRKSSWKEMFSTLRIKVFRRFMAMYLGIVMAMDITSMIFAYFMTYSLKRPDELQYVLGTLLVSQVALVPLASWFAKKTSKNLAVIVGNIGWILFASSSLLLTPESPAFLIYIIASFLGMFIGFSVIGYTSIFGDVTEVGEYHFGYRAEGSFTSIWQFLRKCASALANWLALTLLGIVGFISPLKITENGITQLVTQSQNMAVQFTIKGIMGLNGIFLLIPATIIAMRWKLSKEKHTALIDYLDRKRAGLEIDPQTEQKIEAICKPLIMG